MSEVYLLYQEDGNPNAADWLIGVFSTKERADEACQAPHRVSTCYVEPIEVDAPLDVSG